MARSPYVIEYRGAFSFPCTPDEAWSAMQRFDRFECWWGWLREFRVEGPGLETGGVLHGVVVPPLPYRLRVRIVLAECVRPHHIHADIRGDLEGTARLLLEPCGEDTRATVSSTIEVMQRPIRLAARIAPRALRWGHDRVVESTVTSFRRHLTDLPGRLHQRSRPLLREAVCGSDSVQLARAAGGLGGTEAADPRADHGSCEVTAVVSQASTAAAPSSG